MENTGLEFNDKQWIEPIAKHFEPDLPQIRALQRIDLMSFCSECILPKVDRASMWHSLEVRVPFLDHRIIEWGLRMPVNQKELLTSNSKLVLRRYLMRKVPQKVLNHSKQGFSLKIRNTYNWENALEQIDNSWWVKSGFWKKDWRKIIENPISPRNGRLWFLLMLSKWSEKWLS